MTEVELKIQQELAFYKKHFGKRDCFKTWVEVINFGEKHIVYCSFRQTEGNRRVTKKYRTTIKRN